MEALSRALDDDDKGVREAAGRAFWRLEGPAIVASWALFEALGRSRSLPETGGAAMRALDRSPSSLPDGTLALCHQLAELHGAAMGNISTAAAGETDELIRVVLRMRLQAASHGDVRVCLDVLDLLVKFGAFGVDDALGDAER